VHVASPVVSLTCAFPFFGGNKNIKRSK